MHSFLVPMRVAYIYVCNAHTHFFFALHFHFSRLMQSSKTPEMPKRADRREKERERERTEKYDFLLSPSIHIGNECRVKQRLSLVYTQRKHIPTFAPFNLNRLVFFFLLILFVFIFCPCAFVVGPSTNVRG